MHPNTRKLVIIALFSTTALMLSYIESLFPFFYGVPGMKLGLPNLAVIVCLYYFGAKEALTVNCIRIILVGLLFGNMFSILFSIGGATISFLFIYIAKKCHFSMIGVSMVGGVFHNIGQLLIAIFIVQTVSIQIYGPVLLIAGLLTGGLIGFISKMLLSRLPKEGL